MEAGLGTVVNLAEDVAGPFIGIPRTLYSVAEAFNASANAGSELIKGTAEAIQGTQENFNRLLNNVQVPSIPNVSNSINQKLPEIPVNQVAGRSFKKIHSQSQLIGGRILQSKNDFLNTNINTNKILKQYGSKLNTKRKLRDSYKFKSRKNR